MPPTDVGGIRRIQWSLGGTCQTLCGSRPLALGGAGGLSWVGDVDLVAACEGLEGSAWLGANLIRAEPTKVRHTSISPR